MDSVKDALLAILMILGLGAQCVFLGVGIGYYGDSCETSSDSRPTLSLWLIVYGALGVGVYLLACIRLLVIQGLCGKKVTDSEVKCYASIGLYVYWFCVGWLITGAVRLETYKNCKDETLALFVVALIAVIWLFIEVALPIIVGIVACVMKQKPQEDPHMISQDFENKNESIDNP